MKRAKNLYNKLITRENAEKAIDEVDRTHNTSHGKPNKTTLWVKITKEERITELINIIKNGYEPSPVKYKRRFDHSANKWRDICEPRLWPDQYIHHMIIQVLQPVIMRGMDYWCCSSIRGRGTSWGKEGIEKWLRTDIENTTAVAELDIRHFYDSLKPEVVIARLKQLIKDKQMIEVVERLLTNGIMIGAYFSQWFANMTLQPLDHMIREKLHIKYYIRYMDNLTLFGATTTQLHTAVREIAKFLEGLQLTLKSNWQVFPLKSRLVNALGYRFGREYTLIRKKSLLRLKRQLNKTYKKIDNDKPILFRTAAGLISRIGQLRHCNSRNIRDKYIRVGFLKYIKRIIRQKMRSLGEQCQEWLFYYLDKYYSNVPRQIEGGKLYGILIRDYSR